MKKKKPVIAKDLYLTFLNIYENGEKKQILLVQICNVLHLSEAGLGQEQSLILLCVLTVVS